MQTHELQERAEAVRAYLVELRGGAPFLSGRDASLLMAWLESGVSVGVIVSAVEAVSVKRKRNQLRQRLSLSSCRKEVERRQRVWTGSRLDPASKRHGVPASEAGLLPHPPSPVRWPGLGRLADGIAGMPLVSPALSAPHLALVETLRELADSSSLEVEALAARAIDACRVFQRAAWDALEPSWPLLFAEVEAEIVDLRSVLGEERFPAAVEELARDRLRSRMPLVSAVAVWDSLQNEEGRA